MPSAPASSPRVVLLTGTGSARGIGHATALALARAGHVVYATVRDPAAADPLEGFDGPGRIVVRELDLLERSAMAPLLEEIVAGEGRLDTLVNNAGYGVIGGVEQVDLAVARQSFETNVWGTMALVQEALPLLRRQGHGHIVLVSSCFIAGLPVMGMGYYVAAKAALETILQSLAVEAAPHGIRVTCWQPGPVMTELERVWGQRVPPWGDPRPTLSDELYAWVAASGPTPQQPEEAGEALARLIGAADPPLAEQSGASSRAYVERALRDPTRQAELSALLAELTPPAADR
jgi:NAD(P)-dependent dehydrogenase (short-subunit alcohol dehydrogenase family)